jgi:3-oxoacyl-[acyl-carrier protein] reductase
MFHKVIKMKAILTDKVALVTGGSRGIGQSIVREFLVQGALVYFNYSGNSKTANALLESLRKEGFTNVEAFQCSVTDETKIKKMVMEIKKKAGRIDILVNNAGVTRDNFLMLLSGEEWDQVIKTNLYGVFHCTKSVSRIMAAQKRGVIVNIASVAAIQGASGQSNYSASKGGIIAFTKSAAMELIGKGIRVNCILPGFIQTEMTYKIASDIREEKIKQIPLNRMGNPEEVAYLASFLASDRADYIVGQSFVIDGGLTHGANG